ncbi:HEPN domain protein [Oxobacter pfennigii]|uniref:HEPN domain protein n=1 Tax=Oxobacter pfennigii TaxID=36849 RepID=A0A0P8YZ92_9CLOT|nr:HEPN domain-containing protein [Oxobacter pfennigii]KPU45175.1 HEPN domain protein [Oxobacter pfennigii]
MVDSPRYKDWLNKSERDIKSAKVLKENDCGNDTVAFHCHQAIEKALKGFILYKKKELISGHSLVYLCKESAVLHNAFKNYLKECALINQYYIETRYPADIPLIVTDDDASECIKIAEDIYNMVLINLGA